MRFTYFLHVYLSLLILAIQLNHPLQKSIESVNSVIESEVITGVGHFQQCCCSGYPSDVVECLPCNREVRSSKSGHHLRFL
jgi:hypothetical protein